MKNSNNRMQSDFGELSLPSAADAGVMKIKTTFTFAVLALALSNACFADGVARPIDISECMTEDCYGRDAHIFSPEENLEIQAWFDIVNFPDEKTTNFFPLFSVSNSTQKQFEVTIGMQLLDHDKKILVEAKWERHFDSVQSTEGSDEIFVSVPAEPVTLEIVRDAKFLRVIFRR